MFTNLSKIPTKLGILLVGVGLLVAGCDSAGTNNQKDKTENKVEEKIAFEAVDANLADRITSFDGGSSNSVTTAAQKSTPGFEITDQLDPPTNGFQTDNEAASHLALSVDPGANNADRNLYIGYKNAGDEYGGGIDIASADGGLGTPTEVGGNADATTLRSSAVDVQELAVLPTGGGNDPDALYAATAVDPDLGVRRAPQFHSIQLANNDGLPTSDVTYDVVELLNSEGDGSPSDEPTRVAKSVVVDEDDDNGNGDVFAVSDENTAHGIPVDVGGSGDGYTIDENNISTIETTTGRNYRSLTETSSGDFYALGFNGSVYNLNFGGPSEGSGFNLGSISGPNVDGFSIARLSSYDFSDVTSEEVLFAALNEGGFSVYNPTADGEVYSDPDTYATSAAATEDYVYVASGNGIAVYEVEGTGLSNTSSNDGLEYIGTQTLDSLPNGGNASVDVQINDILIDENGSPDDPNDDVLFVAKSTDGVFRIEVDINSAWNP